MAGRNILKLNDPERIAINNRLGKTIRFLGEHTLPRDFLLDQYGSDNPIIALLDEDPTKEVTLIEAMSLAVFNRAMKGDIRAIEFIRDTIGEKPATNIQVTTEKSTNLSRLTEAQLNALIAIHQEKENATEILVEANTAKQDDDDPFKEDNPNEFTVDEE